MLRIFGWIFKLSLFSLLVLVLGNTVHWHGKTISDQVKVQVSHAERSEIADKVKEWSSEVTEDARQGPSKKWNHARTRRTSRLRMAKSQAVAEKDNSSEGGVTENLPSSERQKLRALIRELNSSYRSSTN